MLGDEEILSPKTKRKRKDKAMFMKQIKLLTLLFIVAFMGHSDAIAQMDTIELNNGSFEDYPHPGSLNSKGIRYWTDCGRLNFPFETPPDLHGEGTKFFSHVGEASDGQTYVAMVSRSNDTYESVSQRLSMPLEDGKCYQFSIDLMQAQEYMSATKESGAGLLNYNTPIILYIYGGTGVCGDQELLAQSEYIKNKDWKTYTFDFTPSKRLRYITFEASYKRPTLFPQNGNILMDNAQSIIQVPCPGEEELAQVEKEFVPPHKRRKKLPPPPKKAKVETVAAVSSKKKESILKLDRTKITKGQVIEIKNLYFEADTAAITENSSEVLEEIYDFLAENEDIKVEIGGHTNRIPPHSYCDMLSSNRAKSVAYHLVKLGIEPNRLKYKGYGKRKPKTVSKDREARKKNQRVEIKILSFDS